MEFLVEITVRLPDSLDGAELDQLIAAERARGAELVESGSIVRIWRVPGALRNVSVWSATDATELHGLLRSLPTYRHAEIDVRPLATHPLEGGPEDG